MTRTKLKDREMPVYTRKEEMFNMISHIVGGVVGIAGMVLCIIFPRCIITDTGWQDRLCSACR
ncbi:MAG: hypothetical protein ACLR4A_18700 [Christensenellales bacterium]